MSFFVRTSTPEDWRLQLKQDNLEDIRYQLLHRTASTVIEAKRFNASTALMRVHSFRKTHKWFEEYAKFVEKIGGISTKINTLQFVKKVDTIDLYLVWITEEQK